MRPHDSDVVTWAPTSSARRHRRGFDQAEVVARRLESSLLVRVEAQAPDRVRLLADEGAVAGRKWMIFAGSAYVAGTGEANGHGPGAGGPDPLERFSPAVRDWFASSFEAPTQVDVVPEDAFSGTYAFWSNKGDESDMTLTREFDFSDVSGPIDFKFRTWYDLEEDYDYLYFEVSEDSQAWQIVSTPSGTGEDPSGNSYGWGYNAVTSGWIQEEIDLSDYAGKKIFVRFEYVTDAAVNGEGMLIDDVSIDAIDYFTDFESDDGGWEAEGFVRIQNALPQTFRLALIKQGSSTTVEMIEVSDDQTAEIPISIGGDVDRFTLVISGTTRFTREVGSYTVEIK